MTIALYWFRQDLRLNENPAFQKACSHHDFVIPLYIYDKKINFLGEAQAWWLHHSLKALNQKLLACELPLILRQGNSLSILLELIEKLPITAVYWNRCYEPLVIRRDTEIKKTLTEKGIHVESLNGSLLNEPWDIRNSSGEAFKIFTPYWKASRKKIVIETLKTSLHRPKGINVPSDPLDTWRLLPQFNWASQFSEYWTPGEDGAKKVLRVFIDNHLNDYQKNRDFPGKNATSRLSPHLHFGEISPMTILKEIELQKLNPDIDNASIECFLSELGWREFSYYLLYHFPDLPHANFKKAFDTFQWDDNKDALARWQKGLTGYPIIDAGMRELWTTGYMHNRVRMIVASFLTKGLLIDWRKGAAWFLKNLLDADLANNSTSWQWVQGSGPDSAPYFRIFNPVLQSKKFDADGSYIRRWVPELSQLNSEEIHAPWEGTSAESIYKSGKYPRPIIDHKASREKALERYKRNVRGD